MGLDLLSKHAVSWRQPHAWNAPSNKPGTITGVHICVHNSYRIYQHKFTLEYLLSFTVYNPRFCIIRTPFYSTNLKKKSLICLYSSWPRETVSVPFVHGLRQMSLLTNCHNLLLSGNQRKVRC